MTKSTKEIEYEHKLTVLRPGTEDYRKIKKKLSNLRRGKTFRIKQKNHLDELEQKLKEEKEKVETLTRELEEYRNSISKLEFEKEIFEMFTNADKLYCYNYPLQ